MSIPYYQVNAFTNRLFGGNPAGVCILKDDWLPDDLMQRIAAENQLSETAYVIAREAHFDLRWFTPAVEVDLCGHATLATAHVLYRHLGFQGASAQFQTLSGTLTVLHSPREDQDLLVLDLPARPATVCDPPQALIEGLGHTPTLTAKARDYLAVFDSEQTIRELQPNEEVLMRLDCLGIIATAPGDTCDFVSRFFAPRAGVLEDPVTGSAHCTLIPYWANRLGRSELRARQLSSRGGELYCQDAGERARMGGHAITYSTGHLNV